MSEKVFDEFVGAQGSCNTQRNPSKFSFPPHLPGRKKKNSMRWGYAGFHSHGGTLVAGWIIYLWLYISWKIPQQKSNKNG